MKLKLILIFKSSIFILFLMFFISCTGRKKVETVKPVTVVKQLNSNTIKLKSYKEINLENGLKIFFIKDAALPRIGLSLMVKTGQRDESLDSLSVNYFTANLLEEGTNQYSANQLADQLAMLGTDFSISPGVDFTIISVDGLTLSSEKVLNLFSEIIFKPAFKQTEFIKQKKQVQAGIKKLNDSPSQLADMKINQIMFNGHPFSFPIFGNENSVTKLKRVDIIKHYLKYYRPNNSYLAITGALTDDFENKVIEVFNTWPKRDIESEVAQNPIKLEEKKYYVSYKKGSVQSQIRVSIPLVPRNHPDHLKIRIANEILGGGFVSRLNAKIRDQMGLTYSINSSVDHRKDVGILDISTFTKTESTFLVVDQIEKELQRFVQRGITAKELAAAKSLLMGQFPRSLETVDAFAFNLMYLEYNGISFNYLTDYYKNLDRISLEDINSTIKTYFDLTKAKYLILGDNAIAAQLKVFEPQVLK